MALEDVSALALVDINVQGIGQGEEHLRSFHLQRSISVQIVVSGCLAFGSSPQQSSPTPNSLMVLVTVFPENNASNAFDGQDRYRCMKLTIYPRTE